jgi:hypothetical protein
MVCGLAQQRGDRRCRNLPDGAHAAPNAGCVNGSPGARTAIDGSGRAAVSCSASQVVV